jgi:hypothetical protein
MNTGKFAPLSLAAVMMLLAVMAASTQAAPTSTTGGTNANTSICKVLSQKGCKSVGIRGDECCPNSGLWCNTNAPSTCTKCLTCSWGQKVATPCGSTSNTVCASCEMSTNVAVYANPGVTCEVTKCNDGFYKNSFGVCVTCSSCTDDVNFETTKCSTESNRVCSNCKLCNSAADGTADSYETGACRTDAATNVGYNRVCTFCQKCNLGSTYEPADGPCTATSNRVCSNTSVCTDGTNFQSAAATLTSDRVCSNCAAKCVAGEYATGCSSPGNNENGVDRSCHACTGVVGVATYVDAGMSCEAATCKDGYDLNNGVCEEHVAPVVITEVLECTGDAPACHECVNGVWVAVSNGSSCNNGGFCSAGSCKVPSNCAGITAPSNGCNILCGFSGAGGTFEEAHCMYVKAAGGGYTANQYVCKTNPICNGGNCDCNSQDKGKPNGRRMLK